MIKIFQSIKEYFSSNEEEAEAISVSQEFGRRDFLKFLGMASVGGAVAYSFPEIIVPKNVGELIVEPESFYNTINIVSKKEIYPSLIEDIFFIDTPLITRIRISDNGLYGFGFNGFVEDPKEENNLPLYWFDKHKILPRGREVPLKLYGVQSED